jgi:hypothetical protein
VKNLATSAFRTALTDSGGFYTVVNLDLGNCEIVLEALGLQSVTRTNLQLLSRQTVRVDGTLTLASQAQPFEVNVQAEAPINNEVSSIAESKLGTNRPSGRARLASTGVDQRLQNAKHATRSRDR